MSKLVRGFVASGVLAAGLAAPGGAAVLGPHAELCGAGHNAMLVHIIGLKARTGTIRVQSYGGDPATFLDKGSYLERVEVPAPAAGAVDICMPVPRPGTYAIAVRHQITGSESSDTADGGGISGNPKRSVIDMAFRRKPDPAQISIRVTGVVPVPIVLNYLQGGSFKPVTTAER